MKKLNLEKLKKNFKNKQLIKGINNKRILLLILLVLLIVAGASYAYFTAGFSGKENETTLTVSGGIMEIFYNGGPNINLTDIYPRDEVWATKTFTVTGNNTTGAEMYYKLNLIVTNNTFSNGAIKYKLNATNTNKFGMTAPSNINPQDINGSSPIFLGNALFEGPTNGNKVHTYDLEIYFPNEDGDQNIDQGKIFSAYVLIESGHGEYIPTLASDFRYKDLGENTSTIVEFIGQTEAIVVPKTDTEGRTVVSITGDYYDENNKPVPEGSVNTSVHTFKGAFEDKEISIINVDSEEDFSIGNYSFTNAFFGGDTAVINIHGNDIIIEDDSFSSTKPLNYYLDGVYPKQVEVNLMGSNIKVKKDSFRNSFLETSYVDFNIVANENNLTNKIEIDEEAFQYAFAYFNIEENIIRDINLNFESPNIDIANKSFSGAMFSYPVFQGIANNNILLGLDIKMVGENVAIGEKAFEYSGQNLFSNVAINRNINIDLYGKQELNLEYGAFNSMFEESSANLSEINNFNINLRSDKDLIIDEESFNSLFACYGPNLEREENGNINLIGKDIIINDRAFQNMLAMHSKNSTKDQNIKLNIESKDTLEIGDNGFSYMLAIYNGDKGFKSNSELNIKAKEIIFDENSFGTGYFSNGSNNVSDIFSNIKIEGKDIYFNKNSFDSFFVNYDEESAIDMDINLYVKGKSIFTEENSFGSFAAAHSSEDTVLNYDATIKFETDNLDLKNLAFNSGFANYGFEEIRTGVQNIDFEFRIKDTLISSGTPLTYLFTIYPNDNDNVGLTQNATFKINGITITKMPEGLLTDMFFTGSVVGYNGSSKLMLNNHPILTINGNDANSIIVPNYVTEIGYDGFGINFKNTNKVIIPANVNLLPNSLNPNFYSHFGSKDMGTFREVYEAAGRAAGTYLYVVPTDPSEDPYWEKQ